MTTDDANAGMKPEESAPTAAAKAPMANVTTTEQLMGLGALLIVVVADLLGNIILDEYSISRVTWIIAIAVVASIWAKSIAGKDLPVPYRPTMVVLGYGGFLTGLREFLADIESSVLGGSNAVFAIATYVGALLLGYGAYQLGRSG